MSDRDSLILGLLKLAGKYFYLGLLCPLFAFIANFVLTKKFDFDSNTILISSCLISIFIALFDIADALKAKGEDDGKK